MDEEKEEEEEVPDGGGGGEDGEGDQDCSRSDNSSKSEVLKVRMKKRTKKAHDQRNVLLHTSLVL